MKAVEEKERVEEVARIGHQAAALISGCLSDIGPPR